MAHTLRRAFAGLGPRPEGRLKANHQAPWKRRKDVQKRQFARSGDHAFVHRLLQIVLFGRQWDITKLNVSDHVGIEGRNIRRAGAGTNKVHGVDENANIGLSDPAHRLDGVREIGNRKYRDEFKDHFDVRAICHLCERGELIQRSLPVRINADRSDALDPKRAHGVQIGGIVPDIPVRQDDQSLAKRNGNAAVAHCGDHLASGRRVP